MNKLYALILGVCVMASAWPVRAQVSTNPNNTIVRFDVLTQGTNFGHLDVELFDQEKPESVKNFLLYVYNGGYSNLLIHRLETNFVLQAGHRRIEKPASTNYFTEYIRVGDLGRITNEFNVGTTYSNTFGTLAIARASGQTNSGSTDFFFNLTDNPQLDTLDGGFTVFGRVINTEGPNTGTNLLAYFRTYTNITTVCFDIFCFFDFLNQLPVSTFRYAYTTNWSTNGNEVTATVTTNQLIPQYRDVFTIQTSILRGGHTPEYRKPLVKVSSPGRNLRQTTNGNVTFTGTAKDDSQVVRVITEVAGVTEIVDGTTNWSRNFQLVPGTNQIAFRSVDRFGNLSKAYKTAIFYKVPAALNLTNVGSGRVIGATNQQLLDIGRNYTVMARPNRGNFFAGWSGTAGTWYDSRITFMMSSGFVLNASFPTNPFPRLSGEYVGLMTPRTTNSGARVAGMVTLSLKPRGTYHGRLQPLTGNYPMRGFFNLANRSAIAGHRGSVPLTLSLTIATNGVPRITGAYTDGTEVADVEMYRVGADAATVPQGHFTFALATQTNSAFGESFGVGTVNVSATGEVMVDGTMPGGAALSQVTTLYSGQNFPLFAKWSTVDAVFGWMAFSSNANSFTGPVRWVSGAFTNANGEAGFVNGSAFSWPTNGESILAWTNGSVRLSGGDLEEALEIPVTLDSDGIDTSNGIGLQLTPDGEGRITGSFVHPVTQAVTPIQGVFLQQSNVATGWFVGTNQAGALRLRATP